MYNKKETPLTPAGLIALAVMLLFLVVALGYAIHVWNSLADVHMSGTGWVLMVAGILVTTGLGAGLMGLVFYSSRHDMDRLRRPRQLRVRRRARRERPRPRAARPCSRLR